MVAIKRDVFIFLLLLRESCSLTNATNERESCEKSALGAINQELANLTALARQHMQITVDMDLGVDSNLQIMNNNLNGLSQKIAVESRNLEMNMKNLTLLIADQVNKSGIIERNLKSLTNAIYGPLLATQSPGHQDLISPKISQQLADLSADFKSLDSNAKQLDHVLQDKLDVVVEMLRETRKVLNEILLTKKLLTSPNDLSKLHNPNPPIVIQKDGCGSLFVLNLFVLVFVLLSLSVVVCLFLKVARLTKTISCSANHLELRSNSIKTLNSSS